MTPSILTAAQEGLRLAEKATKGPWKTDGDLYPCGDSHPYVWGEADELIAKTWMDDVDKQIANCDFIAHCGTHHADICRAYLGLAKENADLRKKMGESDARFYGSAHTKKLMERLNGAQKDRDTARAENAELKRQLEEARAALAQTGEEKT